MRHGLVLVATTMLVSCQVSPREDATLRERLQVLLSNDSLTLGKRLQIAQEWAQACLGGLEWSGVAPTLVDQDLEVRSNSADEITTTFPGAAVRLPGLALAFQLVINPRPEWTSKFGQALVDSRLTMTEQTRRSEVESACSGRNSMPLDLVFRSRAYEKDKSSLPIVKSLAVSYTSSFHLGQSPDRGTIGFVVDLKLSTADLNRDVEPWFFVWDPHNPTVTASAIPDESEVIDGWKVEFFKGSETIWR